MITPGARVGRYSYIGKGATFPGKVVIGDLSMIATGCRVVGNDHIIDDPAIPMRLNFPKQARPVTIVESDVWLGVNVTLMEGVRIGRGSVVATGSIVTRSVEPYSIMAGVPARRLRARFDVADAIRHDRLLYGAELPLGPAWAES